MKSIIIGAGTYGEVYCSYLQEAGVEVAGFLDSNIEIQGTHVCGVPVLGDVDLLETLKVEYNIEAVYCPIGNNKTRVRLLTAAKELGYAIPNFIHHSVNIAPDVKIANNGVYILQNTSVMPFVTIDDYVMISANAIIVHHSKLHRGVFVSNGVNLGANVVADCYAYVGMGSTIMTGVKRLGVDCLVGAGAVVVKDVLDYAVVAGVPAKQLRIKD